MARTAGSHGPKTMEAIRKAALTLIYRKGYEAITLRQLADAVGIQPGSLYNHVRNKQDILFDLVHDHMTTLLAEVQQAVPAGATPLAQLEAFIAFHVGYHITRREQVFIANSELRSLEAGNHAAIVALRKRYEGVLIDILRRGAENGSLRAEDPTIAAYAILSMLTGICSWYQPSGRKSAEQLVTMHRDLILRGIVT
ncbi:TetR/AcrR family transcriptional regulator [Niveispirillum sp.]|uniref:TetR/AcrR family transcriptional regulator n=1 Tax=Niveispirillum sp. TaxID=1917217 RepID=UPI001B63217A|nr:TetR/AcrR family transcriptional regulator [Niveispirillum sp.]MBP7335891.1 TetR family transcriptional regulator [Niveispirillum sp.]